MKLYRMQRPVPAPVVIQIDLDRLKPLLDTVSEQLLNARILGKRNVRPHVEQKSRLITKRRRMTAIVGILVVHHRSDALAVQPMRGAESSHPGSQYDDVWRWHFEKLLLILFLKYYDNPRMDEWAITSVMPPVRSRTAAPSLARSPHTSQFEFE